jgi:hypothetical protein
VVLFMIFLLKSPPPPRFKPAGSSRGEGRMCPVLDTVVGLLFIVIMKQTILCSPG